MPTSASLRSQAFYEYAYVLFIDGLPYAWVTDHGTANGLVGSGAGTWIGTYEQANSDWETLGQRTVLNGLRMPSVLPGAKLDSALSGMFASTSATFELVDTAGILPQLFASEGKDGVRLAQRIPPGIDTLGASVNIEGGTTTNPRGKWIGTEAIGPAGERRWFHALPIQGIGFDHPYPIGESPDLPRPPLVTDEPVDFEGRIVTVFRLHRDHLASDTGYTTWTQWDDAFESGDMVFIGKLRGTGDYDGKFTWRLRADGTESLLKRQLGSLSPRTMMKVTQHSFTLADDERRIIVEPEFRDPYDADNTQFFSSVHLNSGGSYLLPDSGNRTDYVTAINTLVQSVLTDTGGTFGQYNTATSFSESVDSNTNSRELKFQVTDTGIRIQRREKDAADDNGAAVVNLGLHRKLWRLLGFDPELQHSDLGSNDAYQIRFSWLAAGEYYGRGGSNSATSGVSPAPNDGYVVGSFDTVAYGPTVGNTNMDNDGQAKLYSPLYGGMDSLAFLQPGQTFSLEAPNVYLTKDPLALWTEAETTAAVEGSRYFVFKGKRASPKDGQIVSPDTIEDIEGEDFVQCGLVSWDVGATYGSVNGLLENDFYLESWVDPRYYGFNFNKLRPSAEWVSIPTDPEWTVYAAPLNAVRISDYADPVWVVLRAVMCSTGTSTGYSGPVIAFGTPPTFGFGINSESETDFYRKYARDILDADMGLAIPYQLLETPRQFQEAFEFMEDGSEGAACRASYGYAGAFDSDRIIQSVISPRGMMLTWKASKFGVARLAKFPPAQADVAITQDDLYGSPDDPGDTIPIVEIRATGPLDRLELSYRSDALEHNHQSKAKFIARDEAARNRRGDNALKVSDDGLIPIEWYIQAGKVDSAPPPWWPILELLWAQDRATFFAKRHYTVTLKICKQTGQDIGVGTKVRLTNPWVPTPAGAPGDGVTGIVDGTAIVIGNDLVCGREGNPDGEYYETTLLVFADGTVPQRYFMPIGKVSSFSGSTVTLESDHFEAGTGIADAARFARPSFPSSLTGDMGVRLLSFDRVTWTIRSETRTVSSVSGNVVTLSSAFTDYNPYHHNWLVPADYDAQTVGNWARTLGIVIVDDTLQFGSGPTDGFRFVDE